MQQKINMASARGVLAGQLDIIDLPRDIRLKSFQMKIGLPTVSLTLIAQYGRYGTPRITAMLNREDFKVNHKQVERIWREQGLKVVKKQKKRCRLWLGDGSCIRLRPEYTNHVLKL